MNTKKYDIILTDMAKSELEEIYQYIFNNLKEPKIADKLMEKIETEILSLWKYILTIFFSIAKIR